MDILELKKIEKQILKYFLLEHTIITSNILFLLIRSSIMYDLLIFFAIVIIINLFITIYTINKQYKYSYEE